MSKYTPFSEERLRLSADQIPATVLKQMCKGLKICENELNGLLKCRYVGPEKDGDKMRSTTKVIFEWEIPSQKIVARKVTAALKPVYNDMRIPIEIKKPLLCLLLKFAVVKHKVLPGMKKYPEVACYGIGVPKDHEGEIETALLPVAGRMTEHLKCAHIDGQRWLLHPGNLLNENELFVHDIGKKRRLTLGDAQASPQDSAPVRLPATLVQGGRDLDKLMAMACVRAEAERATAKGRDPCLDKAFNAFNLDVQAWSKSSGVFVLWTHRDEETGKVHPHASEAALKTLQHLCSRASSA